MSAPRVLVTAASSHEATAEMAEAIATELARAGVTVDLRPADEVADLEAYAAVVLGSAVYAGRWLGPAIDFARRHREALRARPLWLFSSGPAGDPPAPAGEAVELDVLAADLGAREHRVFPGRLDRRRLAVGGRTVIGVVQARDGDFRPWPEIVGWADGIAAQVGGA